MRPPLLGLALACVASVGAAVAPNASAEVRSQHAFVGDTNNARASRDIHVYEVARDLTEVAQRWANWMAAHQTMRHNPYLTSQVQNWQSVGENVGRGRNEPNIENAFMGDSYHRDNILSHDFTQVGIATARDSRGRLYVDEVFRRPYSQ
jgi:uncharacterized protein YkwD